MANMEKL